MNRTSALFTLMMPAAPNPWNTRASASGGSDYDSAHASEASVNTTSPHWYTRR